MYKVFFDSVELFRSPSIEDALAFALSLHRSSNVDHVINVYDPASDKASITLSKALKVSDDVVRS